MSTSCMLGIITDPVAVNAGLATFFGVLARCTSKGVFPAKQKASPKVLSAMLWGLTTVFVVTAATAYFQHPTNASAGATTGEGYSGLMMGFVGIAFAMFTGIAVTMLLESRKEFSEGIKMVGCVEDNWQKKVAEFSVEVDRLTSAFDKEVKKLTKDVENAQSEWKELPSHLNLLRIGAIAHTSMRYVSAVANNRERSSAFYIVICDTFRKVLYSVTARKIDLSEDQAVSAMKTVCENADILKELAKADWLPVRDYFQALHQDLRQSGLDKTTSAILLGKALGAANDHT